MLRLVRPLFDTITTTIYRVIQSAVGGGAPIAPGAFAGLSFTVLATGATLISALVYAANTGKESRPETHWTDLRQPRAAFASMLRCDPWVVRRTTALGLLAIAAAIMILSAGFAKLCALAALPVYYNRIAGAFAISFCICLAGACVFAFMLMRWMARVRPTMNIIYSILDALSQDYQDNDTVEELARVLCYLLDTQVSEVTILAITKTLEKDPGTGRKCIDMILEDIEKTVPAGSMTQTEASALEELRKKYGKKAAVAET